MLISAKDIIVKSVHLYKENMRLFLSYMGALFVPLAVSILLGGLFTLSDHTSVPLTMVRVTIMILVYLASLWITLTFIRVVAHRYEGTPAESMKQELQKSIPLIWPAILASLLAGLTVFGGALLLIIPGIIFSIWFAFVIYAVAIDTKKPIDAMRASKSLVVGRWFPVFWRFVAPGILFGILVFAAEGSLGFILGKLGSGISPEQTGIYMGVTILFGLVSSALSLFLTPLTTAAPTILYQELKKTPLPTSSKK